MHPAHLQLLHNWLQTISDKYFALDRRLELLCCKSLRGRICLWLLEQREEAGADTFDTALTRAELASYLNCDRSALCRELSRMQEEGTAGAVPAQLQAAGPRPAEPDGAVIAARKPLWYNEGISGAGRFCGHKIPKPEWKRGGFYEHPAVPQPVPCRAAPKRLCPGEALAYALACVFPGPACCLPAPAPGRSFRDGCTICWIPI